MVKIRPNLGISWWVTLVVAATWATPGITATCTVPSTSHPAIQTAVDDVGCDPVVIAPGSFPETLVIARSLTLQGAGSSQSFVQGGIEVQSGEVVVTGLHVSGTGGALWSHSGAEVSGFDLVVVDGAFEPPLFADGFEDGTADAWSTVSP
jgi:nitrous oxidase accessory protein NosD